MPGHCVAAGIDNLRKMIAYAQSGRECRRAGIARGLGESFPSGQGCGDMCDVCTGRVSAELVDMTPECVSLLKTLREVFAKKEKRATSKQVSSLHPQASAGWWCGLSAHDLTRMCIAAGRPVAPGQQGLTAQPGTIRALRPTPADQPSATRR